MASKEQRRKKLADNKAFRKGEMFGIEFSLYVMAWVMLEKFHEPAEKCQKMLDEMEDFCVDFGNKNITLKDMMEVLQDEYHVTISLGRRKE